MTQQDLEDKLVHTMHHTTLHAIQTIQDLVLLGVHNPMEHPHNISHITSVRHTTWMMEVTVGMEQILTLKVIVAGLILALSLSFEIAMSKKLEI